MERLQKQQHLSDLLKRGMKEGDEEEMVGKEKRRSGEIHAEADAVFYIDINE